MLVDEVKIGVKAGHGGRGAVAFSGQKMSLGPTGGNGGWGGSVVFRGVSDLGALEQFRNKKSLEAPHGGYGAARFVDGKDGENLVVQVPVGTVIENLTTGISTEIIKIGEEVTSAKGGPGGKGNYKYRSPVNTSPKEFQPGLPGEEFEIRLSLKMIADVGFVGLPNVGKSTLLNLLTNAKSKVANYKFTTLEPNLGVYYDLILADIPGIIEGASEGKGLGHKFLRHIERTKVLFHFLAADSEDIENDYKVIRAELLAFNNLLIVKPEYLIISRADTVEPEQLKKLITKAKKLNPNVTAISMYDEVTLEPLKKILNQITAEKTIS